MSEKRPYGLTEDDQSKLHRARNVLRLLQYLAEADNQSPMELELLGSAYCLLAEQLDVVIASSENRSGRTHA